MCHLLLAVVREAAQKKILKFGLTEFFVEEQSGHSMNMGAQYAIDIESFQALDWNHLQNFLTVSRLHHQKLTPLCNNT